jgi:hypothetical protein
MKRCWWLVTLIAVLPLAGCGTPACDSACQDAKAQDQQITEQSAWEAEYKMEQDHIQATLAPETETQLRVDGPKVVAYDTCEAGTFGSGVYDVVALKRCYAQLLSSGLGGS